VDYGGAGSGYGATKQKPLAHVCPAGQSASARQAAGQAAGAVTLGQAMIGQQLASVPVCTPQ
jgi:hypothetical protein